MYVCAGVNVCWRVGMWDCRLCVLIPPSTFQSASALFKTSELELCSRTL